MNKNINLNVLGGQKSVKQTISTANATQGVDLKDAVSEVVAVASLLATRLGGDEAKRMQTGLDDMTVAADNGNACGVGKAAKVVGDIAKSAAGNLTAKAVLTALEGLEALL